MTISVLVFMSCLVLSSALTSNLQPIPYGKKLPGDIIPIHYDLIVMTDLDRLSFTGNVKIKVKCVAATNKIVLHAKDVDEKLAVDGVNLDFNHDLDTTDFDVDNDFLIVLLRDKIKEDEIFTIDISFKGKLTERPEGYHVIKDPQNNKYIALTNFVESGARSAFPCFDEPQMRATFRVSLGFKDTGHELSFSSMSQKKRTKMQDREGWVLVEYGVTPPLSTSMVAYMVSGMELVKNICKAGATFWFPKHDKPPAYLSCNAASKSLGSLNKKFKIPKKIPSKLDFIVLPSASFVDLGSYGLATIRDFSEIANEQKRKNMATLMMNEKLTRQWFGGIISPDCVDSMWMVRGLSSYTALLLMPADFIDEWIKGKAVCVMASSKEYPFLMDSDKDVFIYGSKADLKLMEHWRDGKTVQRICEGEILMRMVHTLVLDDSSFSKGVQEFIKTYSNKVAGPDQLWDALSKGTKSGILRRFLGYGGLPKDITVKQIMDTWVKNRGYPVVTVSSAQNGKLKLEQKRLEGFGLKEGEKNNEEDTGCWWIPVTFATSNSPDFSSMSTKQWLGCGESAQELELTTNAGEKDWIIINNLFSAPYHVKYTGEMWYRIIDVLNDEKQFTKIPPMNRALLLNDAMTLGFADQLDYKVIFRLLNYMKLETDRTVWSVFFANSINIEALTRRTREADTWRSYVKTLIPTMFEATIPDKNALTSAINENKRVDDPDEIWTVEVLFSETCYSNVAACVQYAQSVVREWNEKGAVPKVTETYPRLLVRNILCAANMEGEFDTLLKYLLDSKEDDPNKQLYVEAIGCTFNDDRVKRLLDWMSKETEDSTSLKQKQEVFVAFTKAWIPFVNTKSFFYKNFEQIHNYHTDLAVMANFILHLAIEMKPFEFNLFAGFVTSVLADSREVRTALETAIPAAKFRGKWANNGYYRLIGNLP